MSINWERLQEIEAARDSKAHVLAALFALQVRRGDALSCAITEDLIREFHHADVLAQIEILGEGDVIARARKGF